MKLRLPTVTCKRCGYTWTPRTPEVRRCAKCQSAHFDVAKPTTEPDAEPEIKPETKRSVASTWPEGFELTDERFSYAVAQGISAPRGEFEHFRIYCESHGKKYVNWDAAWQNWCRSPYQQQQQKNIADKEPPKKGSGLRNFTKERLGTHENAEKSVEELIGGIGKGMP
jgi:hypothetical protein